MKGTNFTFPCFCVEKQKLQKNSEGSPGHERNSKNVLREIEPVKVALVIRYKLHFMPWVHLDLYGVFQAHVIHGTMFP